MATTTKKVEIIFDVNGRPIDVAVESTLNFKQQIKALNNELAQLSIKGKENTAEFKLLSAKLNETKDNADRVNAKSRELFGTLSLLPGPIGDLAGGLQSSIDLLKTFSGFKLNDIRSQFSELGKDILGIINNILGINKAAGEVKAPGVSGNEGGGTTAGGGGGAEITSATKEQTEAIKEQNAELQKHSDYLSGNAAAAKAYTDEIKTQNKVGGEYFNLVKQGNTVVLDATQSFANMTKEQAKQAMETRKNIFADLQKLKITEQIILESKAYKDAKEGESIIIDKNTGKIALNTESVAANTIATRLATAATEAWTTALGFLEAALAAIGIGIIIAGLVKLYEVSKEAILGTKELAREFKNLNESLEINQELLDNQLVAVKNFTQDRVNILKKSNADGQLIRNEEIDGLKKQQEFVKKALESTNQDLQTSLDKYVELKGKYFHGDDADKAYEIYKKAVEREKELTKQSIAINQEIKNKAVENDIATTQEWYTKTLANLDAKIQLEIEKEQTSTEELNKLLDQRANMVIVHDKLRGAQQELLRKQNKDKVIAAYEEDTKRLEAFQAKQDDIETAAMKNGQAKEITARTQKLNRDKLALSYDKEYQNLRKTDKEEADRILTNLDIAYQEDILKIKETYANKQHEIDKKLLDIQISALKEGVTKDKAIRTAKYDEDIRDLNKLFKDKLITEKDYQAAVINMNQALVNDLKKIDEEKRKKDNEEKLKKLDDEIKFLQIRTDAEKNSFIAYWDDRQKLLDKAKERELAELDITEAQKLDIEKKYVQLSKDLQKEKFDAYLGYVSAGLGAVSNFYTQQQTINGLAMQNELNKVKGNAEEEDKIKEKYFYKNRDAQKGQAVIATLQSAVQAYSSLAGIPIVGPFLGAAAAAAALIFGYKQVDLIASQTYQSSLTSGTDAPKPQLPNYGKNYGDGGMIDGPRHAQGGVMINAEGGEAVMTRGAVTMFAPLLSAMNQMGGGTAFSKGATGQAGFDNPKTSSPAMSQPQIIKTYVVSNELTSEAQKQAKLKNLSTL